MGHFKRGRSKDRRAGCLHCKPWKACSLKDSRTSWTRQETRANESAESQLEDLDGGVDSEDLNEGS